MNNNFLKKNKFIENLDIQFNKQPFYDIYTIKDNFNTKNKSKLELKEKLDPYNYDLSYYDPLRKDTKGDEFIYYSPYDQGPGRGFGNLDTSNKIRFSEPSRNSDEYGTEIFKLVREGDMIDRFDYIDNRYANSDNLVFPFPRSGDTTRKIPDIASDNNYGNSINEYNFNKPKNTINFITNNLDQIKPIIKPNQNIISDIQNNNNSQKLKQQLYLNELKFIESVIEQLKIQYGKNLTKDIIKQKLDQLRKEKYNYNQQSNQQNNLNTLNRPQMSNQQNNLNTLNRPQMSSKPIVLNQPNKLINSSQINNFSSNINNNVK